MIRNAIFFFVMFIMFSCQSEPKTEETTTQAKAEQPTSPRDTTIQQYPERIGNEMVTIEVMNMPPVTENEKGRHWKIRMEREGKTELSIDVTPYVLFELNQTVLFKNAANVDFTDGAIIQEIEYKSVRSNTLYFSAILENPTEGKEVKGRFNLFYSTNRKGEIYGWITDEVR